MPEREPVDREVIVTDGGGRGVGMIVGVIVAILAILLVVWLFMNLGGDEGAEVVPDEVEVTLEPGGEG